ncbi:MAG: hypothetical protein LBK82_04075 [Planctomycetaceae bacterium]|nr:hypothetical protein [Planctomycetaceae bacterium]
MGNHKVGDLLLKGRVGISRLCPCFRLVIGFRNGWQQRIAIVNLIHCRRVRRRDFLANSKRSPT